MWYELSKLITTHVRLPMKLSSCLLLALLSCFNTIAQNQSYLDSLKQKLLTESDPKLLFEINDLVASHYLEYSFDSSLSYVQKMDDLLDQLPKEEFQRRALIMRGMVYDYNYKFDSGKMYYRKAYDLSLETNDKKGAAVSLFNIGTVFIFENIVDSAVYYFLRSEPTFKEIDDKQNLARLYNNVGKIYRMTEKYDAAVDIYKKSVDIKLALDDRKGLMNSYTNLSSAYLSDDKYDSALKYSLKTISLSKLENDMAAYKWELLNVGAIYVKLEDFENALFSFQEAEEIKNLDEQTPFLNNLYFNLAYLYFTKDDLKNGKKYLQLALDIVDEAKLKEPAMQIYQLAYEYYKRTKNPKLALNYFEKYHTLQEEMVSQQAVKRATELEQQYEKEKRERQIAELEAENINSELDLKVSENQRNIFILSSLLGLIVAAFFFYRLSIKRRTNKVLEEKNEIISKSLAERENLLKEIHHRVKNNLQIISSLLSLQADTIEDKNALDAVIEGQNRVKSMALIHQNLYQTDELSSLSIHEYIENLIESLFRSFGVTESQVSSKLEIEDIKFDIDTIIPLGLIINELITNSLKYAFSETEEGEIYIGLHQKDQGILLEVKDNGKGVETEEIDKSKSFGMRLIEALCMKLKGELTISSDLGTNIQLLIKNYKLIS